MTARVVINAPCPKVRVEVQGDDAQMRISAPPAPLVEFRNVGMRGAKGQDGAGAAIYEESFTNLDTWIVNHNFGRKPTSVSILSPGGVEQWADIVHVSDNQLQVLFAQPYTGSVRVM